LLAISNFKEPDPSALSSGEEKKLEQKTRTAWRLARISGRSRYSNDNTGRFGEYFSDREDLCSGNRQSSSDQHAFWEFGW